MRLHTHLVAFLALALPAFAELAGTKPNIVVVITDDQGYANVGVNGHPWLETPNLDGMAAKSARFDRFLVAPTCSPTRAGMMSGRHPMKNGITHTILERERMALSTVTLPTVLKESGYATGMFGKWHLGDEEAYRPKQRFLHGRLLNFRVVSFWSITIIPQQRNLGVQERTHWGCNSAARSAATPWNSHALRRRG